MNGILTIEFKTEDGSVQKGVDIKFDGGEIDLPDDEIIDKFTGPATRMLLNAVKPDREHGANKTLANALREYATLTGDHSFAEQADYWAEQGKI